LSFAVAGRDQLEAAVRAFEERDVEHSDITELPPFGIAVLPFKDPTELPWSSPPRCSGPKRNHPIRSLVLYVDLVSSRRIWPAQVGCLVDPDGSRPVSSDRLGDQTDDQATRRGILSHRPEHSSHR
jgi:hypothetical protein